MTLQQLLEKAMNTDITPLLNGLKTFAVAYVVGYAICFLLVVVFFIFTAWTIFKGFRNFDKFNKDNFGK